MKDVCFYFVFQDSYNHVTVVGSVSGRNTAANFVAYLSGQPILVTKIVTQNDCDSNAV
jgi:hypothetical protein